MFGWEEMEGKTGKGNGGIVFPSFDTNNGGEGIKRITPS